MALWYETGKGMRKVSFHRETNNCVAFLCGGGPSLAKIDPKKLNGPNRIVFGLNNTYPFVRPDVWIAMDDAKCFHRGVFNEAFIKIMRGGYQHRKTECGRVDTLFNMYYADVGRGHPEEIFERKGHDVMFMWKKSTIVAALHIIMWMGCKKIYLFGNDCSIADGEYFNPEVKNSDANRKQNKGFYQITYKYLRWFSQEAKKHGIDVYSCSPGARINNFLHFVDYEEVIARCEVAVPPTPVLLHSNEAEAEWKKYLKEKKRRKAEAKKAARQGGRD